MIRILKNNHGMNLSEAKVIKDKTITLNETLTKICVEREYITTQSHCELGSIYM